MLRVIAQNLAENAIRYSGPGATFTLVVERAADGVVIRGTDDGVGVDESQLPRLFERFFRADRARASRGTGLGLAIVKHVVTQAGGPSRRPEGSVRASRSAARSPLPTEPSPLRHRTFTSGNPLGSTARATLAAEWP
jgi:signal transduction histidine kinase